MVIPQIINLTTKMKKRHIYTVMNTSSPCTKKRNVQENQQKNPAKLSKDNGAK